MSKIALWRIFTQKANRVTEGAYELLTSELLKNVCRYLNPNPEGRNLYLGKTRRQPIAFSARPQNVRLSSVVGNRRESPFPLYSYFCLIFFIN